MNANRTKQISKLMSYALRHRPDEFDLELDAAGWVEVGALLKALRSRDRKITQEAIKHVVATSDKQRFALSDDGRLIRANQGHSIEVSLGYEPVEPPELLYHGTPRQFVESIAQSGLKKGKRHDVHLSLDAETAVKVGSRRGKPVVLQVRSRAMHEAGHKFFQTANGVWLTEYVPAEFIEFPQLRDK